MLRVRACAAHAATRGRPGAQVREREAGIDQLLAPIKDMYGLLVRYEARAHSLLQVPVPAAMLNVHARC